MAHGQAGVLDGGPGNDRLKTVLSGWGHHLHGDEGNDILVGGKGNDTLWGGDGINWHNGMEGNDKLIGGKDHDTMWGGKGDDTLNGGAGHDILHGGVKPTYKVYGKQKSIHSFDASGVPDPTDTLIGGAGNDKLYGDDYFGTTTQFFTRDDGFYGRH